MCSAAPVVHNYANEECMKPKTHDQSKPHDYRSRKPKPQPQVGVFQVPPPHSEGVVFYMRAQR